MAAKLLILLAALLTFVLTASAGLADTGGISPGESANASMASASEQRGSSSVYVEQSVVCRDVEDREPVGAGTVFPSSVGRLFCHSLILGAAQEAIIHHLWYWEDEKVADVPLFVRSPRFRTYSSKTILPHQKGEWRVEIVGTNGNIIGTNVFTLE
jgi:hypothetical protein